MDFTTYANLFQPCAALAPSIGSTPYAAAFGAGFASAALPIAPNRCSALVAAGLLSGGTLVAQAEESLQKLRAYGWEPESNDLHASLAAFEVAPAVAVTFANSLSRASVKDHLCGFSYAAITATAVRPQIRRIGQVLIVVAPLGDTSAGGTLCGCTLLPGRSRCGCPTSTLASLDMGSTRYRTYSMRRPEIARAITSCWICSVPSKMSKILASRCQRSTGYSRV